MREDVRAFSFSSTISAMAMNGYLGSRRRSGFIVIPPSEEGCRDVTAIADARCGNALRMPPIGHQRLAQIRFLRIASRPNFERPCSDLPVPLTFFGRRSDDCVMG